MEEIIRVENLTHTYGEGTPFCRSAVQDMSLAIRRGDWKLLVNPDGTNAELYDLSKDANETQNLAAEHPGLTEELSKSLLAWWERRPRINIQKEVK